MTKRTVVYPANTSQFLRGDASFETAGGAGATPAISGSNGSFTFSTATFGNLNGLSFYTSNGSVVGSYTVPAAGAAITVSDAASSGTIGRLAFTNLNGVTLSLSTGAAGSHTIVGSHNALTSQSNQALSGPNGSFTFQTAQFHNSHGISWSTTTGSGIIASHNGITTGRASNDGIGLNTAQTNVTWTVNSSGLSLNAGGYAGTGTSATNASITLNTNGLAISVAAPGGGAGFSAGVSNLGNTAGSTGISGTQLVLVGSDNMTLSQSTGANGATVSFIGPSPGGGGAATLSRWPAMAVPMASSSAYSGATTTTAGGSRTTFSLYVAPAVFENPITFNTVGHLLTHATVAGTGSFTNVQQWGLYTLNGGTALSLVSSFAFNIRVSQNSVTARSHYFFWGTNSTSNSSSAGGNISATMARLNLVPLYSSAGSLQSGEYWIGYMQTHSSGGAAVGSFSAYHVSQSQSTMASLFATNVSVDAYRFHGIVSSTVTSNAAHAYIMPASINTSAITGTGGSSQNRSHVLYFGSR